MSHVGQRSSERVFHPDYLADLKTMSQSTLRAKRDECRQLEEELSYIRRLLHGKLDIIENRSSGLGSDDLIQRLPKILADEAVSTSPRLLVVDVPMGLRSRRGDAERLVEGLSDLSSVTADEISRLRDAEQSASRDRKMVQTVLDTLNEEIIGRYKNGDVDPADVINGT